MFYLEFVYLLCKFKIVVNVVVEDCVVIKMYDIGVEIVKNDEGILGFLIWVGGGLGCIFIVGENIIDFLLQKYLLFYLEVILCVYNCYGCCDNKFKVCIKILVKVLGIDVFCEKVEVEW